MEMFFSVCATTEFELHVAVYLYFVSRLACLEFSLFFFILLLVCDPKNKVSFSCAEHTNISLAKLVKLILCLKIVKRPSCIQVVLIMACPC